MSLRSLLLSVVLIAGTAFASFPQGQAQPGDRDYHNYPYWIGMMQDESVNFYDVQHAFNAYWEGRKVERSSGFKPFKRWEYMMQQYRINPDGSRRPADHALKEYDTYLKLHPGSRSAAGDWQNLGPFEIPIGKGYKGLGRLNAVAFDPSDPDIIWVGSPSGGLWKTNVGGNEWTSTTDNLPTLGVSAILIDYTNLSVMYIGTGDRDAGDAEGMGVWRSTDGGETWAQWNNGMGNRIVGRLIMHPTDHLYILAATNGGIYRTTNGGEVWSLAIAGNFKDIVFKTNNPNTIFAAAGANFYRSTNGGLTFTHITGGLPSGERAVIGVTPDDPEYVYFLITNGDSFKALFRSTDAGLTWALRSNTPNIMSWGCADNGGGGQAWYDLDIAVDPNDKNTLFAGGVNCFRSTDGGQTWQISSHWWGDCGVTAVHADLHALEYNPLNDRLYAGNDGGIYFTDDGGLSWTLISNGLPISQVYKIGQSATLKDKVVNGYQDNGSYTYMGNYWQAVGGGDGMECAVDPHDAAYAYHTVYFGSIYRTVNNNYNATVAENGLYGIDESGAWITPFIIDEHDGNIMFVGYKNVWRCKNVKANSSQIQWSRISYNLGNNNGQDMRALEQSPVNSNILYASRYDNKLFRTDNALDDQPAWADLTATLPGSGGVSDMECSPFDEDVVYIARDTRVYKSTDRGQTWEDISGTLPQVGYSSIAAYKNAHEGLYISSNLGVYYRDQYTGDWIMFSDGLPMDASVSEVEIWYDPVNPAGDVIRAGTYGRGLWESDMYHSAPVADFSTPETLIPVGCAIDFTDLSSGVPTQWSWTFEGGTPATSSERNPAGIVYESEGTYAVTLTVTNEAGENMLTREEYITVSGSILPEVGFATDLTSVCVNGIVRFTDTSLYCPQSWLWSFDPASVAYHEGTSAASQHPVVEFRLPAEYSVTLTVTNQNGESTVIREDYIHSGGYPLPFTEDFEGGILQDKGWTVYNPDYSNTWEAYTLESDGNATTRMKFYAYFNLGQRDQLITPSISLDGYSEAYLSFDHAYARRFNQVDSLVVYVSDDCGDSWTRVYQGGPDGSGSFETTEPDAYEFFPENAEEWCGNGWGAECITIDLTPWAGEVDLKIMFESFNGLGNNLFLDNILVSNTTGIGQPEAGTEGLRIFPNPARGSFTLHAPGIAGNVNVQVVNTTGGTTFSRQYLSGGNFRQTVDLSGAPKGIYLVRVECDGQVLSGKVVMK
jgi:PKD repeat protein